MEYLKAWLFKEKALAKNGKKTHTEDEKTFLKYLENMLNQIESLMATKMIRKTKTGNFELAEIADLQTENRVLKGEVQLARELLSNSRAFVSTMRLDHYEKGKKDFIQRNIKC